MAHYPEKISKRRILILLIPWIFCNPVMAFKMPRQYRHSVDLELGGTGGLGSLNYENTFYPQKYHHLAWRIGMSAAPIDKNNGTGVVIPLGIVARFGVAHQWEFGITQGYTVTTKLAGFVRGGAILGYRFQGFDSKFYYRIAYTPIFSYLVDFQYQHWAGIGFGYNISDKRRSKK